MKNRIKELGYWVEDKLKDLSGEITPGKRLAVILVMLLLFTTLNLYFTFTAISNRARGQEKKKHLKIEHIQRMELLKEKSPGNLIDSDIGTCYGDTVFYKPENERI